jgi:hypothetical protein
MLCQSGLVGRIQVKGFQVIEAVGLDNLRRCAGFGVGQLHTVVAALSEQAGNQSANFTGTKYEYVLHEILLHEWSRNEKTAL